MTIADSNDVAERRVAVRDVALQLTKALDDERRRIAEGLHDDLGQTLAAANIRLHDLRLATTDTARISAADEIERLIRHAIDSSRSLTFDLRSPVLPSEGFSATLQDLAERFGNDHGITCSVDVDMQPGLLDSDTADLLYRVVRELLQNIATHSGASEARIQLGIGGGRAELGVSDDGDGFDVDARRSGFGLLIAGERVAEVGGTLELRSGVGGTSARVRLPVPTGASVS